MGILATRAGTDEAETLVGVPKGGDAIGGGGPPTVGGGWLLLLLLGEKANIIHQAGRSLAAVVRHLAGRSLAAVVIPTGLDGVFDSVLGPMRGLALGRHWTPITRPCDLSRTHTSETWIP